MEAGTCVCAVCIVGVCW